VTQAGSAVRVTVPATSGNVGPGFDSLGLALSMRDVVHVWIAPDLEPGTAAVVVEGEGAEEVPTDEKHLVVCAAHRAMRCCGIEPPGLRLHCVNQIPHSRGLGSSAAAVVAGLVAGSLLAEQLGVQPGADGLGALDAAGLLTEATAMEGHPDNAAPCLLGGLTISWQESGGPRAVRAALDPGLVVVALVPEHRLATKTARGLLPDVVPHADAARTAGRAALLMTAMAGRTELLLPATRDWLHQDYRAPGMPATAAMLQQLRERGLAALVSGAGPTILVLLAADASSSARHLLDEVVLAGGDGGWQVVTLEVATSGVQAAVLTEGARPGD
jgi:homoserine kinase